MKIRIILRILKNLEEDFTASIFGQYSSVHLRHKVQEMKMRRLGWKPKKERELDDRRQAVARFHYLLRYLEKQGFIAKKKAVDRRGSLWRLTARGREKLEQLDGQPKRLIKPQPIKPKDKLIEDHLKVIVFDIPERKRSYRAWIRQILENYNYRILQKSVWIGKSKLPEDFIKKLKEYNFLDCVHIFLVVDRGTLK